ncbi:MAG: GAF domain-containing protein, partial [Actinomycetales bacterium]
MVRGMEVSWARRVTRRYAQDRSAEGVFRHVVGARTYSGPVPVGGGRMTADALIAEYDVVGHTPDAFASVVEMAALVAAVPMATINILTTDQQHQVATFGFDASICARSDSMCVASVESQAPVVVADASQDTRFAANPFVTGELGDVRFYATHPLVTPSGVVIGTLCVFDTVPRELDDQQEQALLGLADRLVDILELTRRTHDLDVALQEMSGLRDELRRSNEHLSAFAGQVSHDLVGPLATVTMALGVLDDELDNASEPSPSMVSSVQAGLRGADRMETLIRDVLAFARVGGSLRREPTDLSLLARAAGQALGLE